MFFSFKFLPFETPRMESSYVSVQSNDDVLPSIDPSGMHVTVGIGQRANTGQALFGIHTYKKMYRKNVIFARKFFEIVWLNKKIPLHVLCTFVQRKIF